MAFKGQFGRLQRPDLKFCAPTISIMFKVEREENVGAAEGIQIDSELMGRKVRLVTYADLTFADQTFADFSISYYKKPSGSRGRARRALTKRV